MNFVLCLLPHLHSFFSVQEETAVKEKFSVNVDQHLRYFDSALTFISDFKNLSIFILDGALDEQNIPGISQKNNC